jgi:hypothetical protein
MRTRRLIAVILLLTILLVGTGCATKAPTISHIHIGHVVDGWETTPGQAGWLDTAETLAQTSLKAAERASQADASLGSRKSDVKKLVKATHPKFLNDGKNPDNEAESQIEIGVRSALLEASRHIGFSANSGDSSANVRSGAKQFSINSQAVLDRCDVIAALGVDALNVSSVNELDLLTTELLSLAQANLHGEDLNGDGVIGGQNPDEYGMEQLHLEIQNMIDRENPPYSTVDTWYLFNLIRLPSGKWAFRKNASSTGGASY